MEEYLGVFVEPYELDNTTRHNKIYDALYGFEEKCVVSDKDFERYGLGRFDLVKFGEFFDYWQSSEADAMFVTGEFETTVDLISDIEVSSEELTFDSYTVSGFVDRAGTIDILIDEVRSLMPYQSSKNLVSENTAFEALSEMGVPDAEVVDLQEWAQPPEDSRYY